MASAIVLRPVLPEPIPCKICGAPAPPYGTVDFNKSCDEPRAEKLPPLGIPVTFRRCAGCGFLFTECFDDWTDQQFKEFIYNDAYIKLDPDSPAGLRAKQMRDQVQTKIAESAGGAPPDPEP